MFEKLMWVLVSFFVVYFALDLFWFRKKAKRPIYQQRLINILLPIGIIAALGIAIKEMTVYLFLQIFLLNIAELCVLILATTGIVLIFKTSVTTNFAQGTIATVGAFTAAKLVIYLTKNTALTMVPKLALAMVASALTGFLIGLFVDTVIFRRSKYLSSVGKQMITMGLVLVLLGLMPLIFGLLPLTIEQFSYDGKMIQLTEEMILYVPNHNILTAIITVSMLLILFLALRFTKWGLGVRATASNETVAGMMGVNTRLITALSWGIAGAFGGVAMEFAAAHPERTEKLILIASTTHRGYPIYKKNAAFQPLVGQPYASPEEMATDPLQVKPVLDAIAAKNAAFLAYIYDLTIYTHSKPTAEANAVYIAETIKQRNLPDVDFALASLNMGEVPNDYGPGSKTVGNIVCPVLHVWGTLDRTVPEWMVLDNIRALENQSRYVRLEACGHSPLVDCPDALAEAVLDFLS